MAPEAKFELLKYKSNKQGVRKDGTWKNGGLSFIEYLVKLVDADGEEAIYSITDYYNTSNEIMDTRIWKMQGINNETLDNGVNNNSKLGKKILTFVTNEHFYRGDTIEAMFVAGRETRLNQINDSLDSFMGIEDQIDNHLEK